MNRYAYLTSGLAIKALSGLSKAKVKIFGEEKIPQGSIIFVINHFTRIETIFLPYYIYHITGVPVWSLADYTLFQGGLGTFLEKVGGVSTKDPHRDHLIIKTLLTGEAVWIIFPEGRMVKNKKIVEKGQFMISYAGGKHPPHTGAATLAIRTEFYRRRLRALEKKNPEEVKRIMELFGIDSVKKVGDKSTYIVPVNLTYYPVRARNNILSQLAGKMKENIPERFMEEIMTEGTMLLSGVDIDIRFGDPLKIENFMTNSIIRTDMYSGEEINFDDPISSRKEMRNVALKIMRRYMTSIYGMTTVNHDHLFASMLKLMPRKKIHIKDLKRRVFLAAAEQLNETGAHFHTSLNSSQVHLLTDDRYNKFKEFVKLAVDKGVVQVEGNYLIKDMSKFSFPFDFHKARIDNPVWVIANEVEPLTRLQKNVTGLSRKPAFLIRRRIAKFLMQEAVQEYKKDYKEFYIKGESKKLEIGMPFLLKGRPQRKGVLLVHGYMAAPPEVKMLARYLSSMGLWVYVPRLKGHGTSPDDLALRTHKDWMDSVEAGFAIINSFCKEVVVGGFSTGGALALDLAARVDGIKGVFAVCPPMRLQDFTSKFAPAMDAWNRLMKRVNLDGAKMEFIENKPENPHINYFRNPISGVREIELLTDSLDAKLSSIEIPALVTQSHRDPVVNYKGSRRIFERIGSENKVYILFNFDRHCIVLGKESYRVHRVIGNFIEQL